MQCQISHLEQDSNSPKKYLLILLQLWILAIFDLPPISKLTHRSRFSPIVAIEGPAQIDRLYSELRASDECNGNLRDVMVRGNSSGSPLHRQICPYFAVWLTVCDTVNAAKSHQPWPPPDISSGKGNNSSSTSPLTTRRLPHHSNTHYRPSTLADCQLPLPLPPDNPQRLQDGRRRTTELSRLPSTITRSKQPPPLRFPHSTMSLYIQKTCSSRFNVSFFDALMPFFNWICSFLATVVAGEGGNINNRCPWRRRSSRTPTADEGTLRSTADLLIVELGCQTPYKPSFNIRGHPECRSASASPPLANSQPNQLWRLLPHTLHLTASSLTSL